jgi:hypothetical protein
MSAAKSISVLTKLVSAITIVVLVFYFFTTAQLESDKVVKSQEVQCLTAICISDSKLGDSCFEMSSDLKLVSVVERKDGTKRIIIEPSNKQCGSR